MGEEVDLLINNLRGAAKIEDMALYNECVKMGFKTEQADTFSTNGKLLREAASTIESLRASLTRVEEERDARPTIEEWSNEIDRVRDHWKGKLTAQAQDVLSVINPILQGPAGVELSSAQCEQLVLLEDRLSRAAVEHSK